MTGPMQLEVKLDDRDVQRGIRRLIRRGENMRPVFLALKKPFKDDIKDHQKRKEGPDGPWEPRATSTKGRDKHGKTSGKGKRKRTLKRRRKNKMLGKLPTSVTTKSNTSTFLGESKVPWAMAQHEGATVGRGAVLPARPFLYFSTPFLDEAERAMAKHLQIGWAS